MYAQKISVIRWLITILGVLIISTSVGAQTAQVAPDEPCAEGGACSTGNCPSIQPCPVPGYPAVSCPIRTDNVIRSVILSRLMGAVISPGLPVTVQVCSGRVTIIGQVANNTRRQMATVIAMSVAGVVCVDNQLVLGGSTAADQAIASLVIEAIGRQPFPVYDLDVRVHAGVVELNGMVDRMSYANILGVIVENVTGVTTVYNNIVVRNLYQNAF